MYSINQLSVQFSGNYIFDDISFVINPRDRIGLTGKNGAGKTTLLRVITKQISPEKGYISIPSGKTTGYLPQEINLTSTRTVIEEALTAFENVRKIEKNIQILTENLQTHNDHQSKEYLKLIEKLNIESDKYALHGGHTIQADTEKVLLGLGFEQKDFNRKITEFSGGWKMRIELAKILLQKPDLLLLDEPTNHLDIESISWLEDFLKTYHGAIVIVSHDRAFLDNVTERTIEIILSKIEDYKAAYSEYVLLREERMDNKLAAFNNQQRQIADIEKFITRFRYKATKARQVQSKLKLLDKMEKVEVDETDTSMIHFRFPPAPHSGRTVVETEELGKCFNDKIVLKNISFTISKGEKVAFVGKNGEGKTTLSRIIVGDLDYTGNLKIGHNVKVGYYAQNQSDYLNQEKTVYETIDDIAIGDIRSQIRNILGSFLFSGDTIDKKVKVLSGGEKARLSLACLLLSPVNLLVLDEPTNHLDMISKDILKNALIKYDGTMIIVSHDRDFLQALTSKVFEFKNNTVKQYPGDIYDFLQLRKLNSLNQLNINKKNTQNSQKKEISENKIEYERKKEHERERRKILNRIAICEKEISEKENKLEKINKELCNPTLNSDAINDGSLYKKFGEIKKEINLLMTEWEELSSKIEKFNF